MNQRDSFKLLHGPYNPPALRAGDQAKCLYRKCDVVVTSWTDALLSWPRCRPLAALGHPSLLVEEELARAIRTESAAALMYWWGVGVGVVARWRKALGVDKVNNPGSNRLVRAAAVEGASAVASKAWTAEERAARRQRAKAQDFGQINPGYHGERWTDAELALLGAMADEEVAEQIGKSRAAVRAQRRRRKIPPWKGG